MRKSTLALVFAVATGVCGAAIGFFNTPHTTRLGEAFIAPTVVFALLALGCGLVWFFTEAES